MIARHAWLERAWNVEMGCEFELLDGLELTIDFISSISKLENLKILSLISGRSFFGG